MKQFLFSLGIVCSMVVSLFAQTTAGTQAYSMTYDARGRMTSALGPTGLRLFSATYDSDGNLLQRIDGNGVTLVYRYDAKQRLIEKYGPQVSERYTYEASTGNLLSAVNATASETFSYDQQHLLTSATTTIGACTIATTWQRNAQGYVSRIYYAADKALTQTYDALGQLSAVSDWLGHTWTFSNTDVQPLLATIIEATPPSLIAILLPPSAPSLTVTARCQPDGNGATTTLLTQGASTLSFSYTALGQLSAVQKETQTQAVYAYDAIGNRVVMNGTYWIPNHADPLKRPLMECTAEGDVVRYYLWGADRLLGIIDAQGTLTRAYSDERGSVHTLMDATGSVCYTATYGPHGEMRAQTGRNPTPFAWLGGYGVQTLCLTPLREPLYLTRYTLYSSELNHRLSVDPLSLSGGLNLYASGEGHPLAYGDVLAIGMRCLRWEEFNARVEAFQQIRTHATETIAGYAFETQTTPRPTDEVTAALIGTRTFAWVPPSLESATEDPNAQTSMTPPEMPEISTGTKVFRVWSGHSFTMGHSWTTLDPRTVPAYRDHAGLPTQNTGRFLNEGVLSNTEGVILRAALPLDGNAGGIPEVLVPDPAQQIHLQRIQGMDPPF